MVHKSMDTGDGDKSSVIFQTAANPMTEAEGAATEVIRERVRADALTIEDGRLTGIEFNAVPGLPALPELTSLVALTTLQLSGCEGLTALPELSSLVALTTLEVSSCDGLTALPELSSLAALTTLQISFCYGLTALPELSSLAALTTLQIIGCKGLTALPRLSSLAALTTLEIFMCKGLTAPTELISLVALTVTALSRLEEGKIVKCLGIDRFVGCGRALFVKHMVTNPEYAERLGQAVSADPSLAHLVSPLPNTKGERAIDLAAPKCRRAMQKSLRLLKRYAIDQGPPLHLSATAAVLAATDRHDPAVKPPPRRALKLMREADQVCAELLGRVGLDAKYVVPVTAVYVDASVKEVEWKKVERAAVKLGLTLELVDGLTDRLGRELEHGSGSSAVWLGDGLPSPTTDDEKPAKKMRISGVSAVQYGFLLVLHLADRSLSTALTHDHIAGRDFFAVRKIANDLALALDHLHNHHSENRRIHADVKPLNAVRVNNTWTLIDFDVSCELGQAFGTKVPSSGHCPPEMARVLLKAADGAAELSEYLASVA